MARDKTSRNRLRNFCHWPARDRNYAQTEFAPSSELPLVWPDVGVLCLLPATADRAEFLADEPARVVTQPPLAGQPHRGSHFRGAPLAKSSARAADFRWRFGNGVNVRARAKHPASCRGTSPAGFAGVVGIPRRVESHASRRPGLLFAVHALTTFPRSVFHF